MAPLHLSRQSCSIVCNPIETICNPVAVVCNPISATIQTCSTFMYPREPLMVVGSTLYDVVNLSYHFVNEILLQMNFWLIHYSSFGLVAKLTCCMSWPPPTTLVNSQTNSPTPFNYHPPFISIFHVAWVRELVILNCSKVNKTVGHLHPKKHSLLHINHNFLTIISSRVEVKNKAYLCLPNGLWLPWCMHATDSTI